MRVLILESEDSDWSFGDAIRKLVEGKIAPLELDVRRVKRFYDILPASKGEYDVKLAFFFPSKEESAIAAPILLELLRSGVNVFFYFREDVGLHEEEILEQALSVFGLQPPNPPA